MEGEAALRRRLETARLAADAAAAVHRRDGSRVGVGAAATKGRADYVSSTDTEAQAAALAVIRAHHPHDAILAEEEEGSVAERVRNAGTRPLWIVDPLDGTANFLHGHPQHCASVALAVEGRVVVGAVTSAPTAERWWAAEGAGAFKCGRPVRVSEPCTLRDALVGTGFPFKALDVLPRYMREFERVLRSAAGVRRAGSAALDLCYVAQGSLDVFWEDVLMPWDFAAGIVLIREAGGVFRRPDGLTELEPGGVLAGNTPELVDALVEVLAGG